MRVSDEKSSVSTQFELILFGLGVCLGMYGGLLLNGLYNNLIGYSLAGVVTLLFFRFLSLEKKMKVLVKGDEDDEG